MSTPVTFEDCLSAFSAALRGRENLDCLALELKRLFNMPFAHTTNSGRAALCAVLMAMKEGTHRNEVVLPAFVCPSVGRAVVKAGLEAILCDVTCTGSGLDTSSLQTLLGARTLAVVSASLYGYPFDSRAIVAMAHAAGATVIEDLAQCFGARIEGQYAGAHSDACIFSFGMSKVLWAIAGGAVMTSDPRLDAGLHRVLAFPTKPSRIRECATAIQFGLVGRLTRSNHLGPLSVVWSRGMRGKGDCADFELGSLSAASATVAHRLLPRLRQITMMRQQNADYYQANLSGLHRLTLPEYRPGDEPAFLRFPIIVQDPIAKLALVRKLHDAGVNASEMYGRESYVALRSFTSRPSHCPHTEYLLERMVCLPTHPHMREVDMRAAIHVFRSMFPTGLEARSDKPAFVVA